MKGKFAPIDFSNIPVVHICPKCGSEMRKSRIEVYVPTRGSLYLPIWRCKCGHEEKVQGGKE